MSDMDARARELADRIIEECKDYADFDRVRCADLIKAALREAQGEWQDISTAPRDKNIIAKFWHGPYQKIVEAAARNDGGWQDIEHGSCVGWMSKGKPAYWLCVAPPHQPKPERTE